MSQRPDTPAYLLAALAIWAAILINLLGPRTPQEAGAARLEAACAR